MGGGRDNRALIIFLHIPKTAGSSFRQIMYDNVICRDLDRHPMLVQNKREWKGDVDAAASRVDVICGHFPFGLHKQITGRDCEYLTVLRNPVDRVISYFTYVRQTAEHHDHRFAQSTIEQFLTDRADAVAINNLQVRLLSGNMNGSVGDDDLQLAIHNLQHWFAIVGIQERFAKFLENVASRYGWSCTWKHLNRSRSNMSVDRATKWRIGDMNALDIQLYDYVTNYLLDRDPRIQLTHSST